MVLKIEFHAAKLQQLWMSHCLGIDGFSGIILHILAYPGMWIDSYGDSKGFGPISDTKTAGPACIRLKVF